MFARAMVVCWSASLLFGCSRPSEPPPVATPQVTFKTSTGDHADDAATRSHPIVADVVAQSIVVQGITVDPAVTTLKILLFADGRIMVNTTSLDLAGLASFVRATHFKNAILYADQRVQHAQVIYVIDTLRSNGLTNVVLGVQPTK